MRDRYPPMKSRIEVYETGEEDRLYEAVTGDGVGEWQRPAKQLSGPELPIFVSEHRMKFWGGGNPPPATYSRKHSVYYQPEGEKYPVPMDEVQLPAQVEIFRKYGEPKELICFIPQTGIITRE